LLLHGNPTSAFFYRHLIAALKSDYRLVAPDYPGFGRSKAPSGYGFTAQEQAETMVAFFDRLELDDVVVIGGDLVHSDILSASTPGDSCHDFCPAAQKGSQARHTI